MLTIFLPPKRQVVGELGWTAQIIFDQSGKVPAFWRPPYAPPPSPSPGLALFFLAYMSWPCFLPCVSFICFRYGDVDVSAQDSSAAPCLADVPKP